MILLINLLLSLYKTTCSQIKITTAEIFSPLLHSPLRQSPKFVRKEKLVVEIIEATVSPLIKSTLKVHADFMLVKMIELHEHVQQDSAEATERKIR